MTEEKNTSTDNKITTKVESTSEGTFISPTIHYVLDEIHPSLPTSIYSKIRPLDLIFFGGEQDAVSNFIRFSEKVFFGKGDFSHVGIVINKQFLPNLKLKETFKEENTLYIWESSASSTNKLISKDGVLDAETGKGIIGVQIRDLKKVIEGNNKLGVKLFWGRLINNPIDKLPEESKDTYEIRLNKIKSILNQTHVQYFQRSYEFNICRLMGAFFTCSSCCRSECCIGKRWMFCSELVTIIYKRLGILSNEWNPETTLPQELANPEFSDLPKGELPVVEYPIEIK